MTANEIMGMTLSELTVVEFITVMAVILISAIFVVILFFALLDVLNLLFDLVCYLVCKDKHLGGWWFKRDVCGYIGRLKHQTIKAPTEKAYYLYYNRLIGAIDVLLQFGIIDTKLWLKFSAVPSYEQLKLKELNPSKEK